VKLSALCCTYLRPHTLGRVIESFQRQDYPLELRELVILDDAGQYGNQEGQGWRIISTDKRYPSLGAKRNACAALASPDSQGFLVCDDDDIYFPHWFSTQAKALHLAEWSRPSVVYHEKAGALREYPTNGIYHGGWAFRRSTFERFGGYDPAWNNGEDQELMRRMLAAGVSIADPCQWAEPFYLYSDSGAGWHISCCGPNGYADVAKRKKASGQFKIAWDKDYLSMKKVPLPKQPSKSVGRVVELVGQVQPRSYKTGPHQGMATLQRLLREREIPWLRFVDRPSAKIDSLPWFWSTEQRHQATACAKEGRPFIEGPNVLFIYSRKPRIDAEEIAILDAASCKAMFCHSEWYRDLIRAQRGPLNQAPIELWPYPIDPLPEGPLPAEYDLLIFAKNGHRPGLLEDLQGRFSKTKIIHYGQFKRPQLIDAARRSKVCVYLADDDHGPIASAEILLCGCPILGLHGGGSAIQPLEVGRSYGWDRLPPGAACCTDEKDRERLAVLIEDIHASIKHADEERPYCRSKALEAFGSDAVLDKIILALERARASY
jgi:hypothetical protein